MSSPLEAILKRDRVVVLAGLLLITGLAWVYLFAMAGMEMDTSAPADADARSMDLDLHMNMDMTTQRGARGMDVLAPQLRPWTAGDFAMMLSMWAIMMVAMMLPSAAPLLLIYARMVRQQQEKGWPFVPTGAFAAGYVLAWSAFSVIATVLQWALERAALLSPAMAASTPYLGAALLIAAGVYQLTPLKRACLAHCRSPFVFLMHHWRTGPGGAIRMGIEHGLYCVGCCWFLMGLLFVGGVMNLLWVAAIAAFVLLEKAAPRGELVAVAAGILLVAGGLWTGVAPVL